jgi:hypothetical protein
MELVPIRVGAEGASLLHRCGVVNSVVEDTVVFEQSARDRFSGSAIAHHTCDSGQATTDLLLHDPEGHFAVLADVKRL